MIMKTEHTWQPRWLSYTVYETDQQRVGITFKPTGSLKASDLEDIISELTAVLNEMD